MKQTAHEAKPQDFHYLYVLLLLLLLLLLLFGISAPSRNIRHFSTFNRCASVRHAFAADTVWKPIDIFPKPRFNLDDTWWCICCCFPVLADSVIGH
jgi:hypothetical protein